MGFSDKMLWGAATSAIQIEGAWEEDGKAPSVWDNMPAAKLTRNENCHVACDHYHRWREDVALMKEIGLKAYRFSINWPRVNPARGVINEKGLQFYRDLVDALAENGIEPVITLHHSEMPQWVFDVGGWMNEETSDLFAEFVEAVVKALSDKVRYWITLNEPQCFSGDYMDLVPGSDEKTVSRVILLAHGKAVKAIREYAKQPAKIGCTVMGITMMPTEGISENYAAAGTFSDQIGKMGMAWWTEPIYAGRVPEGLKDTLTKEDMEIICHPLDFFAGNVYAAANYMDAPGRANPLVYPGIPRTGMGWPVTDDVLYYFVKFAYQKYGLPVLVSENGYAGLDSVMLDGKVHDPQRTDYIHRYLLALRRAADEDIPILGYMYWSFMDNFEWGHGYDKRFGLVYVDYQTQKRTVKDSAYYYRDVIRSGGKIL